MSAYAAQATDVEVAQAAASVLGAGNAVDAVVAGVFAAAALSPSVLLGPVQLLLGGAGVGIRAVDGRVRQPGRGVQRPRGFLPSQSVPPAARVGVPALPAALAAALATAGDLTLSRAMAPAVELAKGQSSERQKFLKRLGREGPSVFAATDIASEIVAAAGRIVGGLVTAEDLDAVRPTVEPCRVSHDFAVPVMTVPWGGDAVVDGAARSVDAGAVRIVAAADVRGLVAIACYEVHRDTVSVAELGLEAPLLAAAVLRGETRVRPGQVRIAAAPIALLEMDGAVDTALAVAGAAGAESMLSRILRRLVVGTPVDAAIVAPRAADEGDGPEFAAPSPEAGLAFGVARSKRGTRPIGDPRRR